MKDRIKAAIAWVIIIIIAAIAETITVSAHGIAWEEANGHPILTSVNLTPYSLEEISLMARVAQAEYGHGDETDKRLVVSVVLNRLESDLPDFRHLNTITQVVKAPCQFAIADHYTLETLNAVYREVMERTDNRVLWFSSSGYQPYGEPLFERNGHYFTGYER